jgi:site-specific recombinase XerD
MHYLEPNDIAKVLRVAYNANTPKSKRQHLAMLTMYFTGTRVSQMLAIKGEDIFTRDGRYVVMLGAAKRGSVVTPALHMDDDPAFDMRPLIEIAKTKRQSLVFEGLSRQYFNEVLGEYMTKAGLHSMYGHSHVFRSSAAMVIFDATQRIGAVSQFLAHRSPSSAFVYLREVDGIKAQDAMDNLQLV